MSKLIVTPYSAVEETIRLYRPSRLVTLLSPEHMVDIHPMLGAERHLRLGVNDIVDVAAGDSQPAVHHVEQLLAFARAWDAKDPMLIHCWAGISRSTAAAYILLNQLHGPGKEYELAKSLRFHAPHAQPNRLMIRHADKLMDRKARMIGAVEEMGVALIVGEGEIVELPLELEDE